MTYDYDELFSVCRKRKITMQQLIEKLGVTKQTFYKKANNPSKFTLGEVYQIIEILELTNEEVTSIFFNNKVA